MGWRIRYVWLMLGVVGWRGSRVAMSAFKMV